ncbi:MAG TPA: hypothetical protein VF407_05815 [Polyangiaceae bacterium]
MTFWRRVSPFVVVSVVGSSLPLSAPAFAADNDAAACASSYEKAQYLRRDKKLRAAHKELLVCSQTSCPAAVVSDCSSWLAEVEKGTPTVVFDARDSKGNSVADVKVTMDGEPLTSKLDGTAIQVDPGNHTFHFEPANGPAGDQSALVLEGEKTRVITYTITGPGAGSGSGPVEGPPAGSRSSWNGQKTTAVIVGGVGVVALGAGIIFGAMGSSQASSDKNPGGCAPNCSDDEVSSIKTKLIISDIAIPVGIVGIAAGVVLFLTAPKGEATEEKAAVGKLHFDASPTRNGASFGVHGSF